jgi:hypothetical protein
MNHYFFVISRAILDVDSIKKERIEISNNELSYSNGDDAALSRVTATTRYVVADEIKEEPIEMTELGTLDPTSNIADIIKIEPEKIQEGSSHTEVHSVSLLVEELVTEKIASTKKRPKKRPAKTKQQNKRSAKKIKIDTVKEAPKKKSVRLAEKSVIKPKKKRQTYQSKNLKNVTESAKISSGQNPAILPNTSNKIIHKANHSPTKVAPIKKETLPKNFECWKCHQSFPFMGMLIAHYDYEHRKSRCKDCETWFESSKKLCEHSLKCPKSQCKSQCKKK